MSERLVFVYEEESCRLQATSYMLHALIGARYKLSALDRINEGPVDCIA